MNANLITTGCDDVLRLVEADDARSRDLVLLRIFRSLCLCLCLWQLRVGVPTLRLRIVIRWLCVLPQARKALG